MGRIQDKVAVITGAGSGIGRACMVLFAQEGARVVGCSRTQETLDETLGRVTAAGGQGTVVAADVSQEAGATTVIDAACERYGGVDIVVNAAGVGWTWEEKSPGSMGSITKASPDNWREVMGVDLDSVYYVCRAAIPSMQQRGGGAIVNIGSILGFVGSPDAHAYTAAKGAVTNLTRSLCAAYTADGIRSNCVAPGFVDTPMISNVMHLFDDEAMADRLCPMHRAAQPEEIAPACLFLASDEASYVNGSTLLVDGGTLARL